MLKRIAFLFFISFAMLSHAQINRGQYDRNQQDSYNNRFVENENDTLVNKKEIRVKLTGKTHYTDYKVFTVKNDTSYVDTTLSLNKYYRFNFLRKDNLELQPFENQGQTFTTLAYTFDKVSLFPDIGARAKHFNFFRVEDIKYYHVPTPTTILLYRTGMQQGQVFDGVFTFNYTKQFNFAIAFKGLRSLGDYRHALSDHGNMRISMNYHTKNERYNIKVHIVSQDAYNQENGGLTDVSIVNFESGSAKFKDRARLETNMIDAQSGLRDNRYFFDHTFKLWQQQDSVQKRNLSNLSLGHTFNYERKHYEFRQDAANRIFGSAFVREINDNAKYSKMYNEVYLNFTSPYVLGDFKVNVNNYNYSYGYKSILIGDEEIIHSTLTGNTIAIGAEWKTDLKKFNLQAAASTILSGNLKGSFITGKAIYNIDSISTISAGASFNKRSPDFNFLLFQSGYKKYNWQNDFNNEQTRSIYASYHSPKWFDASAQLTTIDDYTYFGEDPDTGQAVPKQSGETVNYLKLILKKDFRLGKFGLENAFIYQNVMSGGDIFRVPDFITRNTLYFADHLFKGDPLYLMTGVTFKYFSKYYMNNYNPLISEFTIQNEQEYGGYPMLDFFINVEISRIRAYFLIEHFNSSFTGYNYYSAPTYPFRDLKFRFGLVWNFFI